MLPELTRDAKQLASLLVYRWENGYLSQVFKIRASSEIATSSEFFQFVDENGYVDSGQSFLIHTVTELLRAELIALEPIDVVGFRVILYPKLKQVVHSNFETSEFTGKTGISLVWDEYGKYREQAWEELRQRIERTQGGIGIIVDDIIEMVRYRGAPFGRKTDLLRESFTDLTANAQSQDDINLIAEIFSVLLVRPWRNNIDAAWAITYLRKKGDREIFDPDRAVRIINELYVLNPAGAIVLCSTLQNFVDPEQELPDFGVLPKNIVMVYDRILQTNQLRSEILVAMKPATVFVSYAREDNERIERLYKDLKKKGFKVWKDNHDLLPGEKWEIKIREAIKSYEFVVIGLSKLSVSKIGYFQLEVKEIAKFQQYRPSNQVYMLPVRLDECTIPAELEEYHCIDLFSDWDAAVDIISRTILTYHSHNS